MSEGPNSSHARTLRAQLAFVLLLLIGVAVLMQGLAGPTVSGAAFSEVIVDQFDMPKQPETYSKLRMLYAQHESRRGILTALLGLLIVLPSGFGLWQLEKRDPSADTVER